MKKQVTPTTLDICKQRMHAASPYSDGLILLGQHWPNSFDEFKRTDFDDWFSWDWHRSVKTEAQQTLLIARYWPVTP